MGPVTPIFRIFDLQKAHEFYLDYLGFQIDWKFDPPDAPIYFQVSRDDCRIHLSEHHGDSTPGSGIRIEHPDVHAYLEELQAKDYKFYNPAVERQPWSSDEMSIMDPFGNRLTFFTTVPEES